MIRIPYKILVSFAAMFLFISVVSAQTIDPNITSTITISSSSSISPTMTSDVTTTPTANPQVNDVSSTDVSGKVTKIDGNKITIQESQNSFKELDIPSGVKIKRDNKDAQVSDIKVDDNVTIKKSSTGQILSVDVTSSTLSSISAYAILGIVLVIALIALVLYMINKSKKGQIMTSVEKIK